MNAAIMSKSELLPVPKYSLRMGPTDAAPIMTRQQSSTDVADWMHALSCREKLK
jgi:hypothetical protein